MALVMGEEQGQEVTISGNSEASIKQHNHSSPAGLLWGTGSFLAFCPKPVFDFLGEAWQVHLQSSSDDQNILCGKTFMILINTLLLNLFGFTSSLSFLLFPVCCNPQPGRGGFRCARHQLKTQRPIFPAHRFIHLSVHVGRWSENGNKKKPMEVWHDTRAEETQYMNC